MDFPSLPTTFALQSVLSPGACLARDVRGPGLWVLRPQSASRAALEKRCAPVKESPFEGLVCESELLEWQGQCWSVRPWVEGVPFRAEGLEPVVLLLQSAAGLHARGVAHGRLRPSNVLVDAQRRIRIVDVLGTGRCAEPGQPIYAAPEQLRGEKATLRSDVFTLGIYLFEALIGRHPWAEGPWIERVHRVLYEDVRWSLEEEDALPTGGALLLRALLSRDPALRPGSAGEVLERVCALSGVAEVSNARATAPEASPSSTRLMPAIRAQPPRFIAAAKARAELGIRRGIRIAQEHPSRLRRGAAVAGGVAALGLISATGLFSGDALEEQVQELIERKELKRAASVLELAKEEDPDRPVLRKLLGDLACEQGQQDRCLEHYASALEGDDSLADDERLRRNTLALMDRADRRWKVAKLAAKLEDVEEALRERVEHEHYWIRWNAVHALEARGSGASIPYGIVYGLDVVHAGTCRTRRAALQQISELGAVEALPYLEQARARSEQTFFGDGCIGGDLEQVISKLRGDA